MSQGAAKRAAHFSKLGERMQGLVAARIETSREIGEIENWMSHADQLDHKKYRDERSKKVKLLHALKDTATNLTAAIKMLNLEESEKDNQSLVMKFYNGVVALEEHGIDVGEDLRSLLHLIEENTKQ